MTSSTNAVNLNSTPPIQSEEIRNLFSTGKLKGRTVSSAWKERVLSMNLKSIIGLATGALAVTAFLAYKYLSQDQYQDMCPAPHAIFEDQMKNGRFDGITPKQLESYYGSGKRSLTALEARNLYNEIKEANLIFSKQALKLNIGNPSQTARNAYNTRSDSRAFVRELGPEAHQKDAEYRDLLVYGSKTGPNFDQISQKYQGDPFKIIEAAGRSNGDVNWLMDHTPDSLYTWPSESTRHSIIDLSISFGKQMFWIKPVTYVSSVVGAGGLTIKYQPHVKLAQFVGL